MPVVHQPHNLLSVRKLFVNALAEPRGGVHSCIPCRDLGMARPTLSTSWASGTSRALIISISFKSLTSNAITAV
jgi:hypothetical protein